ncbi:hypothetical protein PIB30_003616 [Stylosanthes scabra]|uniref:Uncharacterized protein n=1 Tax=Stylosanthes scabra TaxID=79078 RepID=A0ABU6Y058_9FABA|nr:hypothetical protein [Stylosanthes scabra]
MDMEHRPSWKVDNDEEDPSSSQGPSWFREQYSTPKGSRRYRKGNQGSNDRFKSKNALDTYFVFRFPHSHIFTARTTISGDPEFCEDEIDVENPFSGGNRYYYWSFVHEENSQWERSFNWRHGSEKAYKFSSESESLCSGSMADRLALGLNSSGPLKLEDVKNA